MADQASNKQGGVARAKIGIAGSKLMELAFNPVSLQFTISNTLKDNKKKDAQYVASASMKLTMDLIFDTTDTGTDVTDTTRELQKFLGPASPVAEPKGNPPEPPTVRFEWGTI